jgi:hypothetical protein
MSPISNSCQLLTIALAFVLALATLLLWNRLRGPRALRLAARVALLVGGQLAATAAVLVWINIASGGLIVTWQDLLGNESTRGGVFAGQRGEVELDGGVTPRSVVLSGVGRSLRAFQAAPDGFRVTTLTGAASGITSQVYVWTPPQYAANPRREFPVLELLHGVWGSPQGWMGPMNVVAHLEAAEQNGGVTSGTTRMYGCTRTSWSSPRSPRCPGTPRRTTTRSAVTSPATPRSTPGSPRTSGPWCSTTSGPSPPPPAGA